MGSSQRGDVDAVAELRQEPEHRCQVGAAGLDVGQGNLVVAHGVAGCRLDGRGHVGGRGRVTGEFDALTPVVLGRGDDSGDEPAEVDAVDLLEWLIGRQGQR